MLRDLERSHAVIAQARRPTPHDDVAVREVQA